MAEAQAKGRSAFPRLFWLVVFFEFVERGSYYGMMSVLSVYLTDTLGFPKPDVGLIKGTIQPLLYFLPILAGALADRFGYRRMLTAAFALLGTGYLLTSQATAYAAVFGSLVVLGLGAGTFKPIISGSIARLTDESNGTLGFGIFYWSINLGAFLFPLVLVPLLRDNFGYRWVMLASAIGTGAMLLPTLLVFREPPRAEPASVTRRAGLLRTLADAFEIIYSPIALLVLWARRSRAGWVTALCLLATLAGAGLWRYAEPEGAKAVFAARLLTRGEGRLRILGEPNLCREASFELTVRCGETGPPLLSGEGALAGRALGLWRELWQRPCRGPEVVLRLNDPARMPADELARRLTALGVLGEVTAGELAHWRDDATRKTILEIRFGAAAEGGFLLEPQGSGRWVLRLSGVYRELRPSVLARLAEVPETAALEPRVLDDLVAGCGRRPFLLLFVALLAGSCLAGLWWGGRARAAHRAALLGAGLLAVVLGTCWALPDLSIFARILCSVLSLTLLAPLAFDLQAQPERFADHARFLLMVVIYSGFWVLYFQMFDSVLWYVQAYVDPAAVNRAIGPLVSAVGAWFGRQWSWRFDVEIVTVMNALTIIALQLLVSAAVKRTRALPTMVTGIALATAGMAILAVSPGIWVFLAGIVIFSIGEMTAHPKFIAYVGQIAPKSRVAMYMGYLFLYGVIGSSIGGVLGAELYVEFVDQRNEPRTLWLIFTAIGAATVVGLLLYDRLVARRRAPGAPAEGGS